MFVEKSSRHQHIIGDLGEVIICNWLSRSGFEVTIVNHTGIDIVAYHPHTQQRFGITVKSRTRNVDAELQHVVLFRQKGKNLEAIKNACDAFSAEPWIGVYVETAEYADLFLVSLEHYMNEYCGKVKQPDWKMRRKHLKRYAKDDNVYHLHIEFQPGHWFSEPDVP